MYSRYMTLTGSIFTGNVPIAGIGKMKNKMKPILIFIILLLCFGCATWGKTKTEREGILEVFSKDKLIILAYERVYKNTFEIAKNFYQYKKTEKPTYDGFWIWLSKNLWYKHIFEKNDPWGIGEEILNMRFQNQDYIDIQKNYELLDELTKKNLLYERIPHEETK